MKITFYRHEFEQFVRKILCFDYNVLNIGLPTVCSGPACSDTVEPLAGVAKHFRTVVITYSAEGMYIFMENRPVTIRVLSNMNSLHKSDGEYVGTRFATQDRHTKRYFCREKTILNCFVENVLLYCIHFLYNFPTFEYFWYLLFSYIFCKAHNLKVSREFFCNQITEPFQSSVKKWSYIRHLKYCDF